MGIEDSARELIGQIQRTIGDRKPTGRIVVPIRDMLLLQWLAQQSIQMQLPSGHLVQLVASESAPSLELAINAAMPPESRDTEPDPRQTVIEGA